MITDAILDVVFEGLEWFIELLPEATLDLSAVANYFTTYGGYAGAFVDVGAIAVALGIIFGGEAALLTARIALFLWRLTPFSG